MPSREQLERLLAAEPGDVFLNFALAMEILKSGDEEAACEQFAKVNGLDPDYLASYHQRGRLLIRLGKVDEARDVLGAGVDAARRTGDAHAASEMTELLEIGCREAS